MTRSEIMRSVGTSETGPELRLRAALDTRALVYSLEGELPGKPDLTFPDARLAVFVDGCFWHGCPQHYTSPASSTEFWARKLKMNVERDLRVDREIGALGWRSLRVWAHELEDPAGAVDRIAVALAIAVSSERDHDGRGTLALSAVAEPFSFYDARPWWACACGSSDCRVVACDPGGSMKVAARRKATWAELVCWRCGRSFHARPV